MDTSTIYAFANFTLGMLIIGTQGCRYAFNWDIINRKNKTRFSPTRFTDVRHYFQFLMHHFYCMSKLWWYDIEEEDSRRKRWVNRMSFISLVGFVTIILFNLVFVYMLK